VIRAGSQQARVAGYRKAYLSHGRDGRAGSQQARRAGTIKHAGGHYGAGGKGGYVSVGYGGRRGGGHAAAGYGTGGKGAYFDVRGTVYGSSGSYAIGVGYGQHAKYGYGGHHRYGRYRHYPYFRGYPYYASYYAYDPYYGYGVSVAYGWPYFSMGIYYSRPYRETPMVSDGLYARAAGSLEIDIEPGGAFVKIDGKAIGRARDFSSEASALSLAEGTHEVEIYRDGYMTLLLNLEIQAGGYYRLEERLFEGTGLDPRSSDQPVGYGPAPEEDAEEARDLQIDLMPSN
jgi:PEGA domain